jgi:uncharacterized protein (DUF1697 family)
VSGVSRPPVVALLKAVNVAGHQPVAMADLRDLCAGLGFEDVRSLLASGNLVFRTNVRSAATLERQLETEADKGLGLRTDFFVRSAGEWNSLVARNPFSKEARNDPGHLLVMFLKAAPAPAAVEALRAAITGRERMWAEGREAYLVYPDGVGRSRVTNALLEKKLGTRATGRNWNTVLKLGALLG